MSVIHTKIYLADPSQSNSVLCVHRNNLCNSTTTFNQLCGVVIGPLLQSSVGWEKFTLSYTDPENDQVSLTTTTEWEECLRLGRYDDPSHPLRITVSMGVPERQCGKKCDIATMCHNNYINTTQQEEMISSLQDGEEEKVVHQQMNNTPQQAAVVEVVATSPSCESVSQVLVDVVDDSNTAMKEDASIEAEYDMVSCPSTPGVFSAVENSIQGSIPQSVGRTIAQKLAHLHQSLFCWGGENMCSGSFTAPVISTSTTPHLDQSARYQAARNKLVDMGFMDDERNMKLLIECDGVLNSVVDRLVVEETVK